MTERSQKPGRHVVESAIAARDVGLLRKIAAERKDLDDRQRDALSLVADLLARLANVGDATLSRR